MKKKLLSILSVLALFAAVASPASYAATVDNKALDAAPPEAKNMAQETGQTIIYHAPGYYTVGDTIFIDVRTYKNTSDTTGSFEPQIATPPPTSAVWDWSKGAYSGDLDFKVKTYTQYRFTGYSSYSTEVTVTDDGYPKTAGAFTVTAIRDNNSEGASWSGGPGTFHANIVFSGCQPSEKLAFAVSKPDDGGTDYGSITVRHG